jgi:hypothetical protein
MLHQRRCEENGEKVDEDEVAAGVEDAGAFAQASLLVGPVVERRGRED